MLQQPSSSSSIIARKHASSTAIHDALNPSRGIRDDILRRGGTPKNHVKDNAKQLKLLQDQVRLKREQQQQQQLISSQSRPCSSLSNKYRHVPSRLYLSHPTPSFTTTPSSRNPSTSTSKPSTTTSTTTTSSSSTTTTSSTTSSCNPSLFTSKPSTTTTSSSTRKTKIGQVPDYLIQRKETWAKEQDQKRQRQIEKETWPPGTVPIPEDERIATLQYLEQSHKELTLELSRFPITLGPHQVQKYKRHQEVLNKLREVEKGIEVYSQPRVFMAILDSES